jgi:hypothetical protein
MNFDFTLAHRKCHRCGLRMYLFGLLWRCPNQYCPGIRFR